MTFERSRKRTPVCSVKMSNELNSRSALVKNVNWSLITSVVVGIVNICTLVIFSRQLGPSVMGQYALTITILQTISIFLAAGFDQAMIRYPDDVGVRSAARIAINFQAFIVFLLGAIIYGINTILGGDFWDIDPWSCAAILLAAAITFLFYLHAARFSADMNYRFLSIARLVACIVGTVGGLLISNADTSVRGIAFRDLSIAAVLLLFVWRPKHLQELKKPSKQDFLKLWQFSSALWGLNVLERLILRLDYFLVSFLLGKESLGAYFALRNIFEGLLGFLVNPIQTVLYSFYCRLQTTTALAFAVSGVNNIVYFCAVVVIAIVGQLASVTIITSVLGKNYLHVAPVFGLLLIYAGGVIWFENIKILAVAQGWQLSIILARLFQLAALVLFGILLIPKFGFWGSGMSTALASSTLVVLAYVFARRRLMLRC